LRSKLNNGNTENERTIGSILSKKGTHSNLEMNKEWIEKREKDRLKGKEYYSLTLDYNDHTLQWYL
jgi:hypothetical protein